MKTIQFSASFSVSDLSMVRNDLFDITYTVNLKMDNCGNIETHTQQFKMNCVTLIYSEILCIKLILMSIKRQYRHHPLTIYTNNNKIIDVIDDQYNLNYYERQQFNQLKRWIDFFKSLRFVVGAPDVAGR